MARLDLTPDRSSRLFRLRRYLPSFLRSQSRRQRGYESRVFRTQQRTLWSRLTTRHRLALGITVLFLATALGFSQFSGYFTVKKVSILRSSLDLPLAELEAIVREQVSGKSIFSIDTAQVASDLAELRPDLSRVTVSRTYPDTVEVELFKYPVAAELRVGKQSIYLNSQGYVAADQSGGSDLVTLTLGEGGALDSSDTETQIIPSDHLASIREATYYFAAVTDRSVLSTRYYRTAREAHLLTEDNYAIWLDLTTDPKAQIDKLTFAGLSLDKQYEYIDLRVRDKIFYKEQR